MKNIIAVTLTTLLVGFGYYQINLDSASDFERWALKHGKSYYGDEKIYRQTIYYQNKQMIDQHNKRNDVTYLMAENQFMTITNEEFIRLYLNTKSSEEFNDQDQVIKNIHKSSEPINKENIQDSVDWRGLVQVKNQGSCPSSYAITGTSLTEAEFAITKGISISLSVQQIMDCNHMHDGCDPNYDGNTVWDSLFYVSYYGLFSEQQYPYTGKDQWCYVSTDGPWKIKNRWWDSDMNTNFFKKQLSEHPLSIEVDASKWQFYGSGIFSDCSSATSNKNYYALAVGFDSSDNWYVQATFGTIWGESGYIRLAPGNTCGILNQICYVDLK